MDSYIPLSVPSLRGNELKYVTEAIESEWVSTAGPYINKFEDNLSSYVNAAGAVAVQNGTAGLHIALQLMNVGQNDEIIVPTLTFIAAVNPVKYSGAEPIFMDCDDSLCLDPEKLLKFCINDCDFVNGNLINKKTRKLIKAIIVVHVFGNMADMESITSIAKSFNLSVIEDATEALGTFYEKGQYSGRYAGTIGDIGVYSFNGNKIMTTGGGGMIVSNDLTLLERARHLSTQAKSDPLYYQHDQVGFNYRMTNIQAALGLAQLEQLEEFIQVKKDNYLQYHKELKSIKGLSLLTFRDDIRPNYWFYALMLDQNYEITRSDLIAELEKRNVQSRPIWDLIHMQIPYKNNQAYNVEKAFHYLESVINIPCSSNLSTEKVTYVTQCLEGIYSRG